MHPSLRSFPPKVCYTSQEVYALHTARYRVASCVAAPTAVAHAYPMVACPGRLASGSLFHYKADYGTISASRSRDRRLVDHIGVTSLCQWDILIFFYQHHTTLLGVADLARLLGYASDVIVGSLDALEALDLVARSRVSQGVRLYRVCVLSDSPRGAAFARLYTLTADHAGRVRVARQLRRDHPPEESCP